MKRILKAISLVSLIGAPAVAAFAADATSPTDLSNFSPRLTLRGRYAFVDSTLKNNMAMFGQTARFGLNYGYKHIGGVLEVQAGDNLPSGPAGNYGQSAFSVRRALVTMDFVRMKEANVTFAIGRDRLDGSVIYAPDAIKNLIGTNFHNAPSSSNEDGISLKYMGQLDFGTLWASVGYYNNAGFSILSGGTAGTAATTAGTLGYLGSVNPFSNQSVGAADMSFHGSPQQTPTTQTKSRAIVGLVGADIDMADGDKVEARVLYATQPSAVTAGAFSYPTGTLGVARDITNIEASVGYDHRGMITGGLWFQSLGLGGEQPITGSNGNDVSYGAANSDTQSIMTYGVGLTGNSKLFDMKDFVVDGDSMTYGLAYQAVSGEKYSNGVTTGTGILANTTETLSQFTLAAGYTVGPYTLDLNYLYMVAADPIYRSGAASTSTGINAYQTNASVLYLNGVIAL